MGGAGRVVYFTVMFALGSALAGCYSATKGVYDSDDTIATPVEVPINLVNRYLCWADNGDLVEYSVTKTVDHVYSLKRTKDQREKMRVKFYRVIDNKYIAFLEKDVEFKGTIHIGSVDKSHAFFYIHDVDKVRQVAQKHGVAVEFENKNLLRRLDGRVEDQKKFLSELARDVDSIERVTFVCIKSPR